MDILITGGTGFIGRHLCRALVEDQHHITVLSRKPEQVIQICGEHCSGVQSLDSLESDQHFQAIINLSGEAIAAGRWTDRRKNELRTSRIGITEQILSFIQRSTPKPSVLISGSAVGYYGDQGDTELDETSGTHDEFSHQLCSEWETEARRAEEFGVRVCILRIGLVIGDQGGFLKPMILPFRFGLGGPIANGKQWMSWIHRSDLIQIIKRLLSDTALSGAFNATTPHPVTNLEFSVTLAKILRRPAFIPVPGGVLKLLLGEMSGLLTGGQKVLPARLLEAKFRYQYDLLDEALHRPNH